MEKIKQSYNNKFVNMGGLLSNHHRQEIIKKYGYILRPDYNGECLKSNPEEFEEKQTLLQKIINYFN